MTINEDRGANGRGPLALALAGVIAALTASSCCLAPLVLFGLGVSSAWIANLTRLAPYQPLFVAATFVCLGAGGWLVHRASLRACDGDACARPLSSRLTRTALLVAAALVVSAIAFNYLGPLILS